MNFKLPDDLASDDQRAIIMALERYFTEEAAPPNPWVLASRAANTRTPTTHLRRDTDRPWQQALRFPIGQRVTPNLHGRGDAR